MSHAELIFGTPSNCRESCCSVALPQESVLERLCRGFETGLAIPFIIENIESTNSSELFAAFLIITGNSDLYAQYLESPSKHFATRDQKLSSIKSWVGKNEKKMDRLKGLHDQIRMFSSKPS